MKRDYYKLYNFAEQLSMIWTIFAANLIFWILNLPLVICLFTFQLNIKTLPLFLLSALPLYAGFTSLVYSIKVHGKENIFHAFFIFFKTNFIHLTKVWIMSECVLGIISANLLLLNLFPSLELLKIFFLVVTVVLVTLVLNYSIVFVYEEKKLWLTVVYIFLKKPFTFNLSFVLLISVYLIFLRVPIFYFLFGIGITGWLLTLNFKRIYSEEKL